VIKDANGNVVPGVTVNWSTDKGSLSGSTSVTGTDGVAKITLSSTVAGDAQVAVKIGSSASVNAPVVNFTADSATAGIDSSDLTVDKTTLVANNTEFATYTAIVKDAGGNLVPGLSVNWTTSNGTLSGATSTTGTDGKATITLRSTVAGNAQVTAAINGTPVNASNVTFTADTATATIGSGDLTVDKTNVVANDTDIATYTALVKDANGNAVQNYSIKWTTDLGTLSGTTSNTDVDGKATITLKGTKAGTSTVKVTLNGTTQNASPVALIADITTAEVVTVTTGLSKITGTGVESAIQTATVQDAYGNLVANQTVTWSTTLGSMSNATSQTGSDGKAISSLGNVVLTAASNEMATVTAETNGSTKTVDTEIRTVLSVGGKYYWTMVSDRNTTVLTTAEANCAAYGGGRVFKESDITAFLSAGGDFQAKAVSGEYSNNWIRLADKWTTKSVDLYDNAGSAGATRPSAGTEYACVK
jgi:adhesin/invasin